MGKVFDAGADRQNAIDEAVAAVKAGKCIVLPTDTVYGIGANAFDPAAVQSLLDAKRRGRDMPPPVLIGEPQMLAALAESLPPNALKVAEAFWPGGLTLIVLAMRHLKLDLGQTKGTIAVRVPDHEFTRDLLRTTGPLAVSSANVSGQPPATTVADALDQLGETVAVYLDSGYTGGSVPSTIVDYSGSGPGKVLRSGVITTEQLREIDPDIVDPSEQQELADSPSES